MGSVTQLRLSPWSVVCVCKWLIKCSPVSWGTRSTCRTKKQCREDDMQKLSPPKGTENEIPGPRFLHLVTTQQRPVLPAPQMEGGSWRWGVLAKAPHPGRARMGAQASLTWGLPAVSQRPTLEPRTRGHQNYVGFDAQKIKIETHPAVQLLRLHTLLQGAQLQSLVRERILHMLLG